MPTVSIRVSDELKSRLDTLAQESESTLSSVIVDVLNSITGIGRKDYPEETAPYSIGNANRLILRNTELLLAHCGSIEDDERKQHARNAEILEKGFSGEYHYVFAPLRPEISSPRSNELFDILDMFRILRASYTKLNDEEKNQVDELDISFCGFDYSDEEESQLTDYVEYLFGNGQYAELEEPMNRFSDEGNSHRRTIDMYRRMYRCYKPISRKHLLGDPYLSLGEMQRIASARSYNSGY